MSTHQTCWFRHGNRKRQEGPKNTNISPRIFFTTTVGSSLSETAREPKQFCWFLFSKADDGRCLGGNKKTLLGKQPKLRPEQNKTMNVGRASSFSRQSSQWNRTGFPSHKKKRYTVFQKTKSAQLLAAPEFVAANHTEIQLQFKNRWIHNGLSETLSKVVMGENST